MFDDNQSVLLFVKIEFIPQQYRRLDRAERKVSVDTT